MLQTPVSTDMATPQTRAAARAISSRRPVVAAPLSTRAHAVFVLALVASGWGILALRKGDRRHRALGWTWVCAMAAMGTTSLIVPHGANWVAAYVGGASHIRFWLTVCTPSSEETVVGTAE